MSLNYYLIHEKGEGNADVLPIARPMGISDAEYEVAAQAEASIIAAQLGKSTLRNRVTLVPCDELPVQELPDAVGL